MWLIAPWHTECPGVAVDGNDTLEVYRVIQQAADRARRGDGATLIEAKTYRPVPHSSDDDDRTYRSRAEVEEWKKRDPVMQMRLYLEGAMLLDQTKSKVYEDRARKIVDDANEFGRDAEFPAPEAALDNVWGKLPSSDV